MIKMKSINKLLFLLAIVLFVAGCTKKPDIENTTPVKFANEWWVQVDGSNSRSHIKTYNTAANDNTFWIDDFPHISNGAWTGDVWAFQFKATGDLNNLTFAANQSPSDLSGTVGNTLVEYKIKVDVTEGKVIPNGGHSKTGVVVDSIYMKIKFSDDPGTYTLTGHGRTGFFEDEY
jgi:hypothetical protein